MDVKVLIEERVKLHEENKALLDGAGKRALTPEESTQFDARSARMNELKQTIDRQALVDAEERDLAESRGRRTDSRASGGGVDVPGADDAELALRSWALGPRATREMNEAAQRQGHSVGSPDLFIRTQIRKKEDGRSEYRALRVGAEDAPVPQVERRALSEGTTTAGGNAVANELMRAYYEIQKWFGNMRSQSEVVTTLTGATLPWPTVSDTSNTGEIIGEASTVTTTADPSFGIVNLGAFKFSSKAVLVSVELLQDISFDLSGYLGKILGRRIGRIQNNKFTVGAGTTEPAGLVTRAATGKTAAATNTFTFDEIIDLIHSVDPAYRPMGEFMLHDTIIATARKVKDGQGRYLWEPSTQAGQPDRLYGYAVNPNNDMSAALTTGQKIMTFGAVRMAYLIRDAGTTQFVRANELFVGTHQIAFYAFQRSDGNLIDTTAVKNLVLG
jgi:HK97 family phage major capsid protein